MRLCDFDYNLPKELIAQYPLDERDRSRLLVLCRKNNSLKHKRFCDIADYFNRGDLLVLNNTKVILAKLLAHRKKTKGRIEVLLLEKIGKLHFRALIRPLARLKIDDEIVVDSDHGLSFKLVDFSKRIIEFNRQDLLDKLDNIGHVPLPQYIKREDSFLDRMRYQTVYAKVRGAVAAPTAGLHFTKPLLNKIRAKGANIAFITLHIGYGTFAPVRVDAISSHQMEKEYFQIPQRTIKLINQTRDNSKKIFAVGTSVCRTIEANKDKIFSNSGTHNAIRGYTDLFIYPPFEFSLVDSLITNFHLPKSTLYILVSAFAGLSNIKKAYAEAVENRYRFFSYGDAMLIIGDKYEK